MIAIEYNSGPEPKIIYFINGCDNLKTKEESSRISVAEKGCEAFHGKEERETKNRLLKKQF